MVEKVNTDFEGNRKMFWSFVGRKTKGKKSSISSLRNEAGVSITSVKGKLEVLQKHYQRLGRVSVDSDFDDGWKQLVESKVNEYSRISGFCGDVFLDREIERKEILGCIKKI